MIFQESDLYHISNSIAPDEGFEMQTQGVRWTTLTVERTYLVEQCTWEWEICDVDDGVVFQVTLRKEVSFVDVLNKWQEVIS